MIEVVGRARASRRCGSACTSPRSTAWCTSWPSVRRLFDLDADPTVIDAALGRDPDAAAARAGPARASACPARSTRSRSSVRGDPRPAGVGGAGDDARRGALVERVRRRPCPGIARARPHPPLPRAPRPSPRPTSAQLGLHRRPGPGVCGASRRRWLGRPRSLDRAAGPRRHRGRAAGAAGIRALDRATTWRCGRAASATRSRPPTSALRKALGDDPAAGRRRGGRGGPTARCTCGSARRTDPAPVRADRVGARRPGGRGEHARPYAQRFPWSAPILQLEIAARTGMIEDRHTPRQPELPPQSYPSFEEQPPGRPSVASLVPADRRLARRRSDRYSTRSAVQPIMTAYAYPDSKTRLRLRK